MANWVGTTALVALIVMVLSAFALVYVPATYYPQYTLQAEPLSQKPQIYIYLDNPDPYVVQAVANPRQHIFVKQTDTQIAQMIQQRNTTNLEINGSYYKLSVAIADRFPHSALSLLFLASPVVLPISTIVFAIGVAIMISKRRKSNNKDSNQ